MKKLSSMLFLWGLPWIMLGAVSPQMMEEYKQEAQDVVKIRVSSVHCTEAGWNKIKVRVNAKVTSVYHSKSRLRTGQWIKIVYTTYKDFSKAPIGGGSVSVLQPGTRYKAYLRRYRRRVYVPDASSSSFHKLR